MSGTSPDFGELVGEELAEDERARLLRAHEALVSAGPPPELSPQLARPPAIPTPRPARIAGRGRILALAAALAVAVFAAGAVLGDRFGGPDADFVITMAGTEAAEGATASIAVFPIDAAGNWPMEVEVRGLEPASEGQLYELWLTRDGQLAALCGSFLVRPAGRTVVPMNAPFRFRDFDGWVIVVEGTDAPLLTT